MFKAPVVRPLFLMVSPGLFVPFIFSFSPIRQPHGVEHDTSTYSKGGHDMKRGPAFDVQCSVYLVEFH